MKQLVIRKQIKGLIVGYPLYEGKESFHCKFICSLIDYMGDGGYLKCPVTLIDETRSTKDAAVKIFNEI